MGRGSFHSWLELASAECGQQSALGSAVQLSCEIPPLPQTVKEGGVAARRGDLRLKIL